MFSAQTEQLLQWFIMIATVMLVPVAVGLVVVLFKLAFLIHSTSEFLKQAMYEINPLLKELRSLAGHLERIGQQTALGVLGVGSTLQRTGPALRKGLDNMKLNVQSMMSGIRQSFQRRTQFKSQ